MSDDDNGRKKKMKLFSDKEVACAYFRRLEDEINEDGTAADRWQCVVCNVVRKKNSGYSNLMSHVHSKHPDYEIQLAKGALAHAPVTTQQQQNLLDVEATAVVETTAGQNGAPPRKENAEEAEAVLLDAAGVDHGIPPAHTQSYASSEPLATPLISPSAETLTKQHQLVKKFVQPTNLKRKIETTDITSGSKPKPTAKKQQTLSMQERKELWEQERFELEQQHTRLRIANLQEDLKAKQLQYTMDKLMARRKLAEAGLEAIEIDKLLTSLLEPRVVIM